jgi:hypothetical protein
VPIDLFGWIGTSEYGCFVVTERSYYTCPIHRQFIARWLTDASQDLRAEEQRVAAEAGLPPGAKGEQKAEERSSSIPLWLVVLTVLVLGGVVEVIIYGYLERPDWIGVVDKKFWDYLDLLIVPAAIAIGVTILNWMQDARQRKAEDDQKQRELDIEAQRAQDQALQAYLDQLTQLLVTKRDQELIRLHVEDEVRQVIQARSEPLLRTLNPTRRWGLVLFLAVMGLLARDHPLISLAGADLRGVNGFRAPLGGVEFSRANLSEANLSRADLSRANLHTADLSAANLSWADLSGANLSEANLSGAYLPGTDLSSAYLPGANLSGAILPGANLREAYLPEANLSEALLDEVDLSGANLRGAQGITIEELEKQALSLEGATMPNGMTFEDRLK